MLATPSSLCTTLGAAESFSPAHLDKPEIKDLIERAQAYYLGGFFLTHGLESALKLAKQAAEKNKVGLFRFPFRHCWPHRARALARAFAGGQRMS